MRNTSKAPIRNAFSRWWGYTALRLAGFVSNKGKASVRFTGTYETLLTPRLVLQPRFETEIAFQRDRDFGVARGVNDVEAGLRLRYEVRRELAPIGVSFRQSFDAYRPAGSTRRGSPECTRVRDRIANLALNA